MWQKMLQGGNGTQKSDNRFFILNENGFQNGFSLGLPVNAGGLNSNHTWDYTDNAITTQMSGINSNNSINLNGEIKNNNFKAILVEWCINGGDKVITIGQLNGIDLDVNKYCSIFFTHGMYLGSDFHTTEVPSSLDGSNLVWWGSNMFSSETSGTVTIYRMWFE